MISHNIPCGDTASQPAPARAAGALGARAGKDVMVVGFDGTTLQLGFVSEAEFDRVVDPAKMVRPYVASEK